MDYRTFSLIIYRHYTHIVHCTSKQDTDDCFCRSIRLRSHENFVSATRPAPRGILHQLVFETA